MRLAVTVLSIAFAAAVTPAGAAPACSDQLAGVNERCATWSGSYNHPEGRGGNGEDIGRAIAISPAGDRVYVTGQSYDDVTLQDQAIAAFNAATGARLWAARYETPAFDTGSAIVATSSAVFVTGRHGPGGNLDWLTTAYDAANGSLLWSRTYGGPEELDDTAYAIGASPDGSTVFVSGGVGDGVSVAGDIRTVAYDALTGDELWARTFNGGGYDGSFFLEPSPDGRVVYVGGNSRTSSTDAVVLAYAAEDDEAGEVEAGDLAWVARVDNGQRVDQIEGLAVSADGDRVAVTAVSRASTTDGEYVTAAVDASTGGVLWKKTHNGTRVGDDVPGGVAIADDVVVVTGKSAEQPAGFEYGTVAYDMETGSLRWTQVHSSPATPDQALDIAAAPDGDEVFVTGFAPIPRGEAGILVTAFKIEPATLMTVSYDAATGTRRWVAHHNESGIGADVGVDVEVSPNGQRVYLGGTFIFSGVYLYSFPDTKAYAYDFGLIAYAA